MKVPPDVAHHLRLCASDNAWAAGQIEDWIGSLNYDHGSHEWLASENADLAAECAMLRRLILGHRELRALARFVAVHGDLETTNAAALTSIMLDNLASEVEKLDPFA